MSIQVNNINKFYGQNQVLHDVSFTCNTGETLVLLGPSGAGKSSLLRVLNLLENATDGKLAIVNNVFDFSKPISEQKGLALRRKVAWCFNNIIFGHTKP